MMSRQTVGRCEISQLTFNPDATPPKQMSFPESSLVQLKSPIRSQQITSTSSLLSSITEHKITKSSSLIKPSSQAFQIPNPLAKPVSEHMSVESHQITEASSPYNIDSPRQSHKRQGRYSSSSSTGSSNDYYDIQETPKSSLPPSNYNLRQSVRGSPKHLTDSSGSDENDSLKLKSRQASKEQHSQYFNQSRQTSQHHQSPAVGYNSNPYQDQMTPSHGNLKNTPRLSMKKIIINTTSNQEPPNNSIEEYYMEQGGNYISPNASMRNFNKLCTRASKYERVRSDSSPSEETDWDEPKKPIRSVSHCDIVLEPSPQPSLMDAQNVESHQHNDASPLVSRYMGLGKPSNQALKSGGESQMVVAGPKPSASHHNLDLQEMNQNYQTYSSTRINSENHMEDPQCSGNVSKLILSHEQFQASNNVSTNSFNAYHQGATNLSNVPSSQPSHNSQHHQMIYSSDPNRPSQIHPYSTNVSRTSNHPSYSNRPSYQQTTNSFQITSSQPSQNLQFTHSNEANRPSQSSQQIFHMLKSETNVITSRPSATNTAKSLFHNRSKSQLSRNLHNSSQHQQWSANPSPVASNQASHNASHQQTMFSNSAHRPSNSQHKMYHQTIPVGPAHGPSHSYLSEHKLLQEDFLSTELFRHPIFDTNQNSQDATYVNIDTLAATRPKSPRASNRVLSGATANESPSQQNAVPAFIFISPSSAKVAGNCSRQPSQEFLSSSITSIVSSRLEEEMQEFDSDHQITPQKVHNYQNKNPKSTEMNSGKEQHTTLTQPTFGMVTRSRSKINQEEPKTPEVNKKTKDPRTVQHEPVEPKSPKTPNNKKTKANEFTFENDDNKNEPKSSVKGKKKTLKKTRDTLALGTQLDVGGSSSNVIMTRSMSKRLNTNNPTE